VPIWEMETNSHLGSNFYILKIATTFKNKTTGNLFLDKMSEKCLAR
jgi:hypothetical protein